jgi:CBS-domain-containing membrane protein
LAEVEFVSEMMSSPVVTVAETSSVQEAARIMTRKGLKRLAVLNGDNEVVGIVTRADLIRAYVRPDAEIAGEIRQMLAVLPAPLSGLAVEVLDGVAVLSGDVETSAEARAIIRIVGGIEGVARVRNDLDWEVATELGDNPYSGYPLEGAKV